MYRKLYRDPTGQIRLSDACGAATHFSELPEVSDPRWVKGRPTVLDTRVLTLSPFSSGKLGVEIENKTSQPIGQYPNHPPFEGVVAWMPLELIQWEEIDYRFSLPGVWDDLGNGYFAKFYGKDRARWIEAHVYDLYVILTAKATGLFGGVMMATRRVGEIRVPVRAQRDIYEAVDSLEKLLESA